MTISTVYASIPLDSNSDDSTVNDNEGYPRRLVRINTSKEIFAYGGTGPDICKIVAESNIIDSESETTISSIKPIRHWGNEESIRSVAVSNDGRCIVIANDIWEVKFHSYKNVNIADEHPFLASSTSGKEWEFVDTFDATVRDIQFYPDSSNWVAIATEGGMCLINLLEYTSNDNSKQKKVKYLLDQVHEYHDSSGIRCVQFHRLSSSIVVLASIGMDGRLCLWDVSDLSNPGSWKLFVRESAKCIPKNDVGEILDSDPWDRSCRPNFVSVPRKWSETTSALTNNINKDMSERVTVLVLPGMPYLQLRRIDVNVCENTNTSSVKLESFDQIDVATSTDDTGVHGHIESIVTFETIEYGNTLYLVSTGRDKRIVMWSIQQRKIDGSIRSKFIKHIAETESSMPTCMLWDDASIAQQQKENGKLLVINADSTLGILNDQYLTSGISPNKNELNVEEEIEQINQAPSTKTMQGVGPKSNSTDKVEYPINSALSDDVPQNQKTVSFADDDDSDAVSNSSKNDLGSPSFQTSDVTKGGNNTYDDDEDDNDSYSQGMGANYLETVKTPVMTLPELQAPFGVSSTPLDLPRRYLCWNHIGSLTLMRDENFDSMTSIRNSIDIYFTDTLSRRNISFTDNLGFILGSLGDDGAIFATDLNDEDNDDENDEDMDANDLVRGLSKTTQDAVKRAKRKSLKKDISAKPTGSTLFFNRFDTFAYVRDKNWVITLPSGERAVGCSCGKGWAAAVTSRRFLRFFTTGGNEGRIVCLPGEPVSIVGRGRLLAVFYHESEPLRDGTQKIGYAVMNGQSAETITKGSVSSISSGSLLAWAGFSNDGSLTIMDSHGLVSMLVHSEESAGLKQADTSQWEWIPMLETDRLKKSLDDSYWPISVYDGKVVCVPLKGGTCYPDASRRPVTTALGFKIPLALGCQSKGTSLEEISLRACIALHQKKVVYPMLHDDNVLSDRDFLALSAQVDKVTLKLFVSVVQSGKLERALDLVDRLHLEKSYDLAMTIADKHRKLVSLIEEKKNHRFHSYGGGDDGGSVMFTTDSSIIQERKRISPMIEDGQNLSREIRSRNIKPRLI